MDDLLGHVITGIQIDNDQQEYLVFHVRDGEPIVYVTDGECCSYSWFYHVLDGMLLIGEPVLEIEEVDVPDVGWGDVSENEYGGSSSEFVQCYGYAIKSPRGVCRIEFRNSSNGCYGGSIKRTHIDYVPEGRLRWLAGDYTTGLDGNVIL